MLLENGNLKCDACGKFVRLDDIYKGNAIHRMLTPDSILSRETWETLCSMCKAGGR